MAYRLATLVRIVTGLAVTALRQSFHCVGVAAGHGFGVLEQRIGLVLPALRRSLAGLVERQGSVIFDEQLLLLLRGLAARHRLEEWILVGFDHDFLDGVLRFVLGLAQDQPAAQSEG